ncbi:GNAT family N-acetyltransferase [Deinococcus sp. Marseille-Q6407]|uniref:GNAT family N-acetyltransferase n=1 Tax=Deinococcus sp. Marseille-Q6407 TaxID=2969223 RepID=UPI0021C0CBA4|nr:GNAT family N-acetyltransferase [Deinococcus sp. Marseille-Q6407]
MSFSLFKAATLTPETTTEAQRLALGQLLSDRYARSWPEEPPLVPELEARTLFTKSAGSWRRVWAVWDGAAALAWAQLEGSHQHNTHSASLNLLVHPDYEAMAGDALRRTLWTAVADPARAQGIKIVATWGVDRYPEGLAFLPAADPYALHRWTRVPDEYLARVADLQAVINDMPTGDSELGELVYTPQNIRDREAEVAADGETRFMTALEDTRTGRLVAYSETYWGPQRPELAYQGATAVRRECRGLALGKWVKADMLRWLREAAPGARFIKTNVAEENDAMNALNRALGFRPYAVTTEWEVRL